jgi:hypothetical protein
MSRFIDDGAGITFLTSATLEGRIASLVRKLQPDTGVEFLVGAIASICTNDQLEAFAMHLEEMSAK